MTEKQILKKAIEKARKNGYKPDVIEFTVVPYDGSLERYRVYFNFNDDGNIETFGHDDMYIIFSHAFAKAFWGVTNGSPCMKSFCECEGWHEDKDRPKSEGYYPRWQYHLQQMVLEENPILYLEKFL